MTRTATVLYPGEMGSALATALSARGWAVVTCLEGRGDRTRDAATAAGMEVAGSLREAVADADLVVSLVPQRAVLPTAQAVAAALPATARPVYLDANSVGPATVAAVAAVVEPAGCGLVDGAFVGSAAELGTRTRLFLSGPRATEVADLVNDALDVEVLGPEVGLASAFKLAFAGFNKGLVALLLEAVAAAERGGFREPLLERFRTFYPGTMETVERLLPTYPRHATRRSQEMEELVAWARAAGQRAAMAAGTADVLRRLAAAGLDDRHVWTAAEVLEACARAGFLSEPPTG